MPIAPPAPKLSDATLMVPLHSAYGQAMLEELLIRAGRRIYTERHPDATHDGSVYHVHYVVGPEAVVADLEKAWEDADIGSLFYCPDGPEIRRYAEACGLLVQDVPEGYPDEDGAIQDIATVALSGLDANIDMFLSAVIQATTNPAGVADA